MGFLNTAFHPQLQQLFEQSVDQYPHNVALVCEGEVLTYQELERRTNQFAHYLIQHGVNHQRSVGILLERSLASYISVLAVLKTGAAYVFIEAEYPDDRINHILSDMSFHLVITSTTQYARRATLQFPASIIFDDIHAIMAEQSDARPPLNSVASNQLCYVIYTSGSTGKPKGVEISHRSICHYVKVASDLYQMTAKDRIYQGFSLSFDASLEELWMAWANGGTLIACTSKDTRAGVGLIDFLNDNKITVFSTVPTLLSTLEPNLPHLRLLILGGEACTAHLVQSWSRGGLKIINTYGPTEATVIATYAECHLHEPVTIGRPLPGYDVFILDEHLRAVPDGAEGELCIAGEGLARGYVNRPEMTAAKFVPHPEDLNIRLYRTGDLAMRLKNGDIQFLGRVDCQIKLRGFRIELNEIEMVIMEYPGINQAIVSLQPLNEPTLVGYLLIDQHQSFDKEAFQVFLDKRLPDYMIPVIFEPLAVFPLLSSGKVDRKQLPKPTQRVVDKEYIAPRTELEREIARVWERSFEQATLSISADFFNDLGGHSLLAAKVVSNLRKMPALQTISIVDIYNNPTISQLAQKFSAAYHAEKTGSASSKPTEQSRQNTPSSWTYSLCAVGQFFGCLLQYAVSAWELLAVIGCYALIAKETAFISWSSAGILLVLFLAMPLAFMSITIMLKWLLLGRVKPGRYRLWGGFYCRWWLVRQLQKKVFPVRHLMGSPLINVYYRLMGAKIGKNCFIGTDHIEVPDLLEIGDNTSIGYDARLLGYTVEDGFIIIGGITIGRQCFVGARCVLNLDTVIEEGGFLDDMSMLPRQGIISRHQYFTGSPAKPVSNVPDRVKKQRNRPLHESTNAVTWAYCLLHAVALLFISIVHYASFVPGMMIVRYFYTAGNPLAMVVLGIPLGALALITCYLSSVILCKKIFLNTIKPGTYPIHSVYYVRQWMLAKMLEVDEVTVMADSLYFPFFLRLLGAKIGRNVEMGNLPHVIPDLIYIDEAGFTASSVAFAWPEFHAGQVTYTPAKVGKHAFIGNVGLLPGGSQLADGALLGCLTMAPSDHRKMFANTSWLGSPAIFLPKRELFEGFTDRETIHPPKKLVYLRLFIELFRIILPTSGALLVLLGMLCGLDFLINHVTLTTVMMVAPFLELGVSLGVISLAVLLKWVLLGKMKPDVKPLWDILIWKVDIVTYLYENFINKFYTEMTLGTPFAALLLRALGAKIGKRVFIDSHAFAEFDLITVGDDVSINADTIICTHLYEDRIFKMSTIVISDQCNIGCGSIILYNTLMEKNASLGSFSLLMKGERLPANTSWEGSPAQSTLNCYHEDEPPVVAMEIAQEVSDA